MRYVFSLLKQRKGDTVLPQLRELELFHLRHNVVVDARGREVFWSYQGYWLWFASALPDVLAAEMYRLHISWIKLNVFTLWIIKH